MHIPDGLLDVRTCAATALLAAPPLGYALYRVRNEFADRTAPLMGVVAASLFAAQMINFPVPGGTSGHLLGGVLAAVMLGPWSGLLVLSVVLLVQALLFQDGGITAFGANTLNVGVIGCLVGYSLFESVRRLVGGQAGAVAGAVLAGWFTAVLGAAAAAFEMFLSGTFPLGPTLGAMLVAHSLIGFGEALITGLVVSFVLQTRPDLVYVSGRLPASARLLETVVAGLALALVVAVLLSPFASQNPDGLEWSLARLGLDPDRLEGVFPSPMPDYAVPGMEQVEIAGALAGAIGTCLVFLVAFLLARGLERTLSRGHSPDAS